MTDRYQKLREEYEGKGLDGITCETPWPLFDEWQRDAENAEIPLANAMALATSSAGMPSVRMVLLKKVDDEKRLWFFTDYESLKGGQLADNPSAALLFYWQQLHRQIRVRGTVERLTAAQSDAYFHARPRASSLSAMASHQSHVTSGRDALEKSREQLEAEFDGRELERPERWGGFALSAQHVEFWQGRPDRLHHRLSFELGENLDSEHDENSWSRCWLAP